MSILKDLHNLGLAEKEAKVYIALLRLGEAPVGELIGSTGFHRDVVYSALSKLEFEGLVQSLEKKKIKHYQATDPKALFNKFQKLADKAKAVLPSLENIFKKPEVAIKIHNGPEGLEDIEKDWATSLKDNDVLYSIGGAGKQWYDLALSFYKPYHEKLRKRGIIAKTVTYPNEVPYILQHEAPQFNTVRVLPEEFQAPSATIIYADKILIQIFGESYIGIVIQSIEISESYKKYFDILWKVGKPINKK